MKDIIIINGSIRKKSTYTVLENAAKCFKDYNIDFINIKDYQIEPCTGCQKCIFKGACPLDDQANEILDKITKADGIIIGTPVYLRQISGYLKILLDRTCSWYHRTPIAGKPVLFITTTQMTGGKQAIEYLKDLSLQWGTIYTGNISRTMFHIEDAVDEKLIEKFKYYLDDKNRCKYKPTLKEVIEFHTQKVLAANVIPLDLDYWKEKDYLDKPYYYDCRINIFKRLIGWIYFKTGSYFIQKNKT